MSRKWLLLTAVLLLIWPLASQAGGGPKGKGSSSKVTGVVADLATDSSSFTLQCDKGKTVSVLVTSSTTITKASDGATTTLANGYPVTVSGTQDSTTKAVTASTIVVNDKKTNVKVCGSVTSLASDGSGFTLQMGGSQTLAVTVSSSTTITNLSDGSTATLADGQRVQVAGVYDPIAKSCAASAIVVNDIKPTVTVFGTTSGLASDGASFTLTDDAGNTLTVTISSSTTVTKESDSSGTLVTGGVYVKVTGALETTTNTVAATTILICDVQPTVTVRGVVSNLASDSTSFTIKCHKGSTVTIAVGSATITKKSTGATTTLANGQDVIVTGALNRATKTIAATAIVVDDSLKPQTAEGTIASIDTNAGTLVLTVSKASFTPTGTTIAVVATSSTTVKSGKSTSSFSALTAGSKISVKGPFDATTQTMTASSISVCK